MPTSKTIVSLEIRVKELEKQLNTTNEKLKGIGTQGQRSADQVNKSFDKVKQTVGKFAMYFGAVIGGAAVVGAIKKSIDAMKEFEQSFTNVLTLMSEAERKKFGGFLRQGSIDLMKNYGFAVQDVNKALFDSISAGIKAGDSIKFMNEAAKLAKGGVTSLSVAVDGMTSIMNAYRLEAKDAEKVSAAFFTAQKFGKTTVEELASSIGRLAPIAKDAGISYQEMLSALALLTQQGISTDEAVTGLRATIVALTNPAKQAQDTLKDLGVESGKTAIRQNGLGKTLLDVAKAAETDADKLGEMIPNVRALTAVAALGEEALADYDNILKEVNEDYGEGSSLAQAYRLQAETLSNSMERIKGEAKAAKIALGEFLAPLVKGFADLIAPVEGSAKALQEERTQINSTILAATALKEGTEERKTAIDNLIASYPEYFGNLDSEKTKNEDIATILKLINEEYAKKIVLSEYEEQLGKLSKQEQRIEKFRVKNIQTLELLRQEMGWDIMSFDDLLEKTREVAYDKSWFVWRRVNQEKATELQLIVNYLDKYGGKLDDIAKKKTGVEAMRDRMLELLGISKDLEKVEIPPDPDPEVTESAKKAITELTGSIELLFNKVFSGEDRIDAFWSKFADEIIKKREELQDAINDIISSEKEDVTDDATYYYELWKESYEGRVANLKAMYDSNLISQAEYNDKSTALEQEKADAEARIEADKKNKKLTILNEYLNITSGFINAAADIFAAAKQRELNAAGDNAKKREEIERKYYRKEQLISITQAIINGALAITALMRKHPPPDPLFWIGSTLTGAATAASIALIASQKFAKGGYEVLGGKRHSEGGTMIPIGEAERGEGHAVFSRWATERYGRLLPDLVDAINAGNFPRVNMDVQEQLNAGEKLMRFFHTVSLDDSKQLDEIKKILSRDREQVSYITDKRGDKYKIVQKKGYFKKMRIR